MNGLITLTRSWCTGYTCNLSTVAQYTVERRYFSRYSREDFNNNRAAAQRKILSGVYGNIRIQVLSVDRCVLAKHMVSDIIRQVVSEGSFYLHWVWP